MSSDGVQEDPGNEGQRATMDDDGWASRRVHRSPQPRGETMKALITALVIAETLWGGIATEPAVAQTDTDMEFRMWFPTGSSTAQDPLRLEITIDVNGTPKTKIV